MVLISYDLRSDQPDYQALYSEIQNLGGIDGALRILESTWVVDTRLTPDEVTERLRTVIKKGDRFIVVNLDGRERRQGWLAQSMWEWILQHDGTSGVQDASAQPTNPSGNT